MVNQTRIGVFLAEFAWLLGFGLVLGIGFPIVLWAVFIYALGAVRRWSPILTVALIAVGVAGGQFIGHLPLLLTTAVALWRGIRLGRDPYDDTRLPFLWGIAAGVGEFLARPVIGGPVLIAVAVFSLVAMVPYGRHGRSERVLFAGQLLAVGVGLAGAAAAVLWIIPWGRLGNLLLTAIIDILRPLLSLIPPLHLKGKPFSPHTPKIKTKFGKPKIRVTHAHPHWPEYVLIGLGVLAAATLAWLLYRAFQHNREERADRVDEEAVIRERVEVAADWFTNPFEPLPPVRQALRRLLIEARRRGFPRDAATTVREWAEAHPDPVPDEAIRLYEAVRYGSAADTRDGAERLRALWPPWPRPPRPTRAARR